MNLLVGVVGLLVVAAVGVGVWLTVRALADRPGPAPPPWTQALQPAVDQIEAARQAQVEPVIDLDLGGGVTMKMVLVPPGEFLMGSPADARDTEDDELPQHPVTITAGFYLGAHEVTRAQFAAFVSETQYQTDAETQGWAHTCRGQEWGRVDGASWRAPGFAQEDDHPVVCVSWNDVNMFCKWLSRKAGRTVRLPTEAEWEYACRAGTATLYHWGDDPDQGYGWCNGADRMARRTFTKWWDTFAFSDGAVFTSPVGRFRPNAWGLSDMHGNVWEWCSDWYDETYYARSPRADPPGPGTGQYRVLRGGSWDHAPRYLRSANRFSLKTVATTADEDLWDRLSIVGFRCAASLSPPSP